MIRHCIESNVFKTDLLAITSPLPGETYINGVSSVRGTGIPGATITLHDTGAGWYDAGRVSAEGVWEAKLDLHPVSNHPLKARQRFNGVESDWSKVVIFNVLSHIPVPTLSTPVNGSEVRTVRPLISGQNGVPGATVRFYEAGSGAVLYGTAVVGRDGKWANEPTVALPARQFSLMCDQFGSQWQSGYSAVSKFTVNAPSPPFNLRVKIGVDGDNEYAEVSWEINPADVGKKLVYVCYLNDECERSTSLYVTRFDDLRRNTYYSFTVFAVDALGVRSDATREFLIPLGK
jgi:hypothetical protein